VEIFFDNMRQFILALTQHLSGYLQVPNEVLENYFPADAQFTSVLWHYLPVTREILKEAKEGFATGMHEHRDPSTFFNLLIQNRIGLQAQNHQGAWIDIPIVEGGVVFNIGRLFLSVFEGMHACLHLLFLGMQLHQLTGGKMIATNHRVNTLKIDTDRLILTHLHLRANVSRFLPFQIYTRLCKVNKAR
jgi:isopenicillin N synthase-like dioxygenase